MNNVIDHYDKLIGKNNDPVQDVQFLQDYMNKWDGKNFFDQLGLDKTKTVLEIGVGTGRLAIKRLRIASILRALIFHPKLLKEQKKIFQNFRT